MTRGLIGVLFSLVLAAVVTAAPAPVETLPLPVLSPASMAQPAPLTATVVLTWTASTSVVAGYNIYRETAQANDATQAGCFTGSKGVGPGCLKLNTTPITGLTYTDATAPTTAPLWYTVRSQDSTGNESVNSTEVAVTFSIITKPAPPLSPKCTVTIANTTGTTTITVGTCQ